MHCHFCFEKYQQRRKRGRAACDISAGDPIALSRPRITQSFITLITDPERANRWIRRAPAAGPRVRGQAKSSTSPRYQDQRAEPQWPQEERYRSPAPIVRRRPIPSSVSPSSFPASPPDHAEKDNRLFLVRIVFRVEIREAPPVAEGRRMKSVIALPASDFMHWHLAFDRCRESYPRRSELHQNYCSRDGDEQSAVPAGV